MLERPLCFVTRVRWRASNGCWRTDGVTGSDAMGFAAFAGHKYLNLETFKKSGEGVRRRFGLRPIHR